MSQSKDKLVSFAPLSRAIPGMLVIESMLLPETRGGWLQGVSYSKGQNHTRDRAAQLTGPSANYPWKSYVHQQLPVLVCLSQHNKLPQTGYLKQQKVIAHSSAGWKFEVRVPAWSGSGKSSLPSLEMSSHGVFTWLFLGACTWEEKEKEISSSTSPIRFRPDPLTSFNFNYPLKSLSLKTVTFGIGVSTYELGFGSPWHSLPHTASLLSHP